MQKLDTNFFPSRTLAGFGGLVGQSRFWILKIDYPGAFPADVLEDMGDMPNYNDWIVSQFSLTFGRTARSGAGLNDFRAVAPICGSA